MRASNSYRLYHICHDCCIENVPSIMLELDVALRVVGDTSN